MGRQFSVPAGIEKAVVRADNAALTTLNDVEAAAARLQGHLLRTPCVASKTLSDITGAQVFLKFENLQFTSSFKERGACNKMAQLTEQERGYGVIAMSAGNHAQGVAYHARRLGVRAVIVMPRLTPGVKVERTRDFGADIVLHGDSLEEARAHALLLAQEQQLIFVHPYDDADVVAGQGTVALEILQDLPDVDTLVVPVGGGGLIAGIATAAKAIKPDIQIVGVQSTRFPAMVNAVTGTHHVEGGNSIAEGIAVSSPGKIAQSIIARLVDDLMLVDEDNIEQAIVMLLEVEKTLAEGAGAVGLAALLKYPERFRSKKVTLVLSGGNIDPLLLAAIIERAMVRAGRLTRIRVSARDVPGTLAKITSTVALAGANIMAVHHQRAFTTLAAQNVEVELVIQTRGPQHITDVMAQLLGAGLQAQQDL